MLLSLPKTEKKKELTEAHVSFFLLSILVTMETTHREEDAANEQEKEKEKEEGVLSAAKRVRRGDYATHATAVLSHLLDFFRQNNNLTKIVPIISGESKLSLSIIDWFVTNYSKQHGTIIEYHNEHSECVDRMMVHLRYRATLNAYRKKNFDPFCRHDRIAVPVDEHMMPCEVSTSMHIETTIGQLNFFKWALETQILDYVSEHHHDIEQDMKRRHSGSKTRKSMMTPAFEGTKTRKKREELSKHNTREIQTHHTNIRVDFA